MRINLFRNFINRIRFGVVYFSSSLYFKIKMAYFRNRYFFAMIKLILEKISVKLAFRSKRIIYHFVAFIPFLVEYFNRNWWSKLMIYLTVYMQFLHLRSMSNWFVSFTELKKKRIDFLELYHKRRLQLYNHLMMKNWVFLSYDRSLFRQLSIYASSYKIIRFVMYYVRSLSYIFRLKDYKGSQVFFPFTLIRKGYRLQYQLDSVQLAKYSRDPMLLTENNMLYVRYYYPFTYNREEGATMNITDVFKSDVLPAGPDLFDFEAYFEFDGTPPFPYEEESWDLSFSLPDRFRSWLNHTTFFGTKNRVAKLMMDYELYQLHIDLEELLTQMKDRDSASYIGVRGVDDYFSTFKTLNPESKFPLVLSKRIDAFDKFWEGILEKLEDNPYAGFSTIQTLSFIGAQIGGALFLGLSLAFLIHGEYESFIRVHAPWLQGLHYTKLFYRNSTHYHYSTHWFAQQWWPFLYEGSWWSMVIDPTYLQYVVGRIRSNSIWLITALVGVRGGYSALHPTFKSRFKGVDDEVWQAAFLKWNREPYALGENFESEETYRFIRHSNDVYFSSIPFPNAALNLDSWWDYFICSIGEYSYYLLALLTTTPLIFIFILFSLLFFFVKVGWFYFFPLSSVGSGLYLSLSTQLSSILPYVKTRFKNMSTSSNPFSQAALKLDSKDRSISFSNLIRFRTVLFGKEAEVYYDYFIYPSIEDLLSFKFNYLNIGREYAHFSELNSLYPYSNWVGWYAPTLEEERIEDDLEFLTEEGEDEEDDSDEPGTDTDYELEFVMTSFHYRSRSPLYSRYFMALESRYYELLINRTMSLSLLPYQKFLVKDFGAYFTTVTAFPTTFYLFLLSLKRSDIFIPIVPTALLKEGLTQSTRYKGFIKRLYNLQVVSPSFNFRFFELDDIVLPTMLFPNYNGDSTDLIITYNDIHFIRRASFVNSLLSSHWYKRWLQFFFYEELSTYFHFLSLHTRSHESVFRNDPILRDLPEHLQENYGEIYEMLDEELDESILDTNSYPIDFIDNESDSDNELKLHGWFENAITMKIGQPSSVFTYDLPFMFYTNNEREELVYSLNDFYWATNTMKTWIPVVPEEEIDYVQYFLFSKTVGLGAYLFNGFYATLFEGFLSDDSFVLNRAHEARQVEGGLHPGYNIYSFDQLEIVGAWPYGLGINQLDRAVVETVMRRLDSSDPDAMDWINFNSMDLKQFPHLTYEQRMYMLLDWKMRQFFNAYVMFDLQNNDAADTEVMEYYSFEPWIGETELWVVFPNTYSYDSIW